MLKQGLEEVLDMQKNDNHKLTLDMAPPTKLGEWISVENGLPNDNKDVLVIDHRGSMAVSVYFTLNGKDYHWEDRDDQVGLGTVTHWMPLPAPPANI